MLMWHPPVAVPLKVNLVRQFMAAYHSGGSLCHQLIMGAGKTTVVTLLLSLLLGDGKTCSTQVQCLHAAPSFSSTMTRLKCDVLVLISSRLAVAPSHYWI